jgi:hypothetical protein
VGSDGGAEHRANIVSLVETCKLNDVDPLAYLTDILTSIDQLIPRAYCPQVIKAVAGERRSPLSSGAQ